VPIKGTIFVHHDAASKRLNVYAVNHGGSPGTLTHNIRRNRDEAFNRSGAPQHDDNNQFGHGAPVPGGSENAPQVASLSFPIGGTYHTQDFNGAQWQTRSVTIEPGAWLRVGFRQRAFTAIEIPPAGEVVEIPYETLESQRNGAMERSSAYGSYYRFEGWMPEPLERDGRHVPPAMQAILAQRSPHVVAGAVHVEPISDPKDPARLVGWDVTFENHASGAPKPGETQGFTGTVVVTDILGQGEKNAGLGLESMPCPGPNTSARQRIVAEGPYSVVARPGVSLRVGVRGYATGNMTLPSLEQGRTSLQLSQLKREHARSQTDWFDGAALQAKLGEKKNRVDFFVGEKRINAQIPDTIYVGAEAYERAEFKDPPRVRIEAVAASGDQPGGWNLTIENQLPDADHLGPVGFPVKPWIEVDGKLESATFLRKKKLTPQSREATWFLPRGADVGGQGLAKGATLVVDTGPLGWRGTIALPGAGQVVDTADAPHDDWVLRESDYLRAGLIVDG
jgi:hypothetical protein